ncbi:hypothetical protein C8R45DRAFT_983124 [Mycena sanguinolenta]|nr:hypothetical protein C8R45DRAFT_983124 [Mycena sanguinolenta]
MVALQDTTTISTLPHELLGVVFTELATVSPTAPLVLAAVSRLFRHVAYTTPSVWSHLSLDGGSDESSKATLWFQLSKAHHVDVQIDLAGVARPAHGTENTTAEKEVPAAVEALQVHTHRIDSLSVRADRQAQAHAALAAIYAGSDRGVRPNGAALRSLRIRATRRAVPGVSLVALPAIPSLVELKTTNIPLRALLSLELVNLQSLRLVQPLLSAPMAVNDIVELVRGIPGLRRLQVNGRIADPPRGGTDAEPCFLEQLEALHVRANNVVTLLDQFVVPALQVLHIDDLDGKRVNASGEMGEALHRLLVRIRLGKGEVRTNKLRVLELAGVEVEQSAPVWQWCTQRMKLDVFSVDSPVAIQEEVVQADPCPSPRTRAIEAGFGFGFGFCN